MDRLTPAIVLVAIFVTLFLFSDALLGLNVVQPAPHLQIDVNPRAIPISGAWGVSTYLYFPNNMSRVNVNSSVVMVAIASNHIHTTVRKNTLNGQASFDVIPQTIAVDFQAAYANYTASSAIEDPIVIAENHGEAIGFGGIAAGTSYLNELRARFKKPKTNKLRALLVFALGPIAALGLPIAYFAESVSWFGSGWIPSSVFGIPVWVLPIPSVILAIVSYSWPR